MTDFCRAENLTPASRVEELAASFVARFRRGERPSIAEYTRQDPDLAGQIEEIFPALVAIEQVQGDLQGGPPNISPLASAPTHSTLGDFRIIREIGRGGMGVVYEAEQISLGRRVALKVLSAALLSNQQHCRRFQREARAAAQLHHTNIVPVFGVGEQNGVSYYVMQFIQGLGLDDVLKELVHQHSGVACGPTLTAAGEAPAAVPRATVSAGEMAGMLCSGEFQRTVLLAGESGDSDSAASEEPANEPAKVRSPSLVDTRPGHLSGTGPHTQQYAFPDQTSDTARSASRNAYWDSIARIGVQVAEVLERCPTRARAHSARGLFFAMLGEVSQSESEFDHAVRLSPESPEIFRAWGTACHESGRPLDALPKYARAAELAPMVPDNWTLHGNLALRLGEFAAARNSYSKPIQMRAENFDAYMGRAAAHFHLQDFEAAIADCRQAAALKSGDPGLPISLSVQQIADCPNADFQQQLVDLMAENLTRPEVDAAMGNVHLGNLLNAMGRHEAALRTYEAAVAPGSERHELLHKLAHAYAAAAKLEDDPQRREDALRRAVTYSGRFQAVAAPDAEERQEHAYRTTRLAMFLHKEAGRPAEAVEHYDAALATFQKLEADPDAQPSRKDWYRRELGYFEQFLASCHLELGNLKEARRFATASATRHRDLVERLPDVPDYPERLGWNEAILQEIAEQESSQQPPME